MESDRYENICSSCKKQKLEQTEEEFNRLKEQAEDDEERSEELEAALMELQQELEEERAQL